MSQNNVGLFLKRQNKNNETSWSYFLQASFSGDVLNSSQSIILLSLDMSFFEINVDPDQPASKKPTDQGLRCVPLCLLINCKPETMQHICLKIREECSILQCSAGYLYM